MENIESVGCGYPTLYSGVEKDRIETFLTEEDIVAKKVAYKFSRSIRAKSRPLERAINNYFKRFVRKKINTLRRNGTLRLFAGGRVAKAIVPVSKALTREEEEEFIKLILKYGDKLRDEEAKKILREHEEEREDVIPLIWPSSFYTAKRRILGETIRTLEKKATKAIRDILASSTQDTIRPSPSGLASRISDALIGIAGIFSLSVASKIANTEVPSFKNFGKHISYKKVGFKKLRWVSIVDSRTRPANRKIPRANHIVMDKRETKVGVPFNMAVSGASMYYPGDPSGPPYEIINCRCTIMPLGKPKR